MKKIFLVVALVSTIQTMQPAQDSQSLAETLAKEIASSTETPDKTAKKLRNFMHKIPEAKNLLSDPSTRREIIMPLIKKVFKAHSLPYSNILMISHQELMQKVRALIDSFGIPELSKWFNEDFSYYKVSDIVQHQFPILLDKKSPTVGDLFQAIVEQTGRPGPGRIRTPIQLNSEQSSILLSSVKIPMGTELLISTF